MANNLNYVDCTGAPNCTALRRSFCYKTANTCGSCLPGLSGLIMSYLWIDCTALNCSALHYISLHCTTLMCIALHYTALHRMVPAVHCTTPHGSCTKCLHALFPDTPFFYPHPLQALLAMPTCCVATLPSPVVTIILYVTGFCRVIQIPLTAKLAVTACTDSARTRNAVYRICNALPV